MNYATIKYNDISNGDGVRTSLFVSGCRQHCKGCFNKIAWNFNYGQYFDKSVKNQIISSLYSKYISGLTILGGEPLDVKNQPEVFNLIKEIKENKDLTNKTIWIYTGYIYPIDFKIWHKAWRPFITKNIFKYVDILVDGPFIEELKDISLKFRGSSNQRILNLNEIKSKAGTPLRAFTP